MLATVGWFAPQVAVLTGLRDRPLAAVVAGIDGSIASGSASWAWLGPIEYRHLVLRDCDGRAVAAVDTARLDRGLLGLAWDIAFGPARRTRLSLSGVAVVVTVEPGQSSLEQLLASRLARPPRDEADIAADVAAEIEIELTDAVALLCDASRGDAWLVERIAAGGVVRGGGLDDWTLAGRVSHAGRLPEPVDAVSLLEGMGRAEGSSGSVAAAATAVLARQGGFSVAASGGENGSGGISLATHRLPMGISSVAATRLGWPSVIDGLADMRLDLRPMNEGAGWRVEGIVEAVQVAVCDARTLAERLAIATLRMPIDCSTDGRSLAIRRLSADGEIFTLQARGRIPLAGATAWDWLERAIDADFEFSGEVDLAAASKARPGGLELRPDVRVTAGRMRFAGASRGDGTGRMLELRLDSQGLEATQGTRQLKWKEPFSAWLKGVRGDSGLRIDEARLTAAAIEAAVSGNREATRLEWSADLDRLAEDLGDVLDLAGISFAGRSRGIARFSHGDGSAATAVMVSGSVDDFLLELPGRPRWEDRQLALEGTGIGRIAAGGFAVEEGHLAIEAGGDTAEVTLAGGAAVVPLGGSGVVPALAEKNFSADLTVAGDLGRWQARLAGLAGEAFGSPVLAGSGTCQATVGRQGEVWQVTRAGGELTDLLVTLPDGRRIDEPRVVANLAGVVHPLTGQVDVSSAEILSATVSFRSSGLVILPAAQPGEPSADGLIPRFRGGGQWQADVGRLERWLLPPLSAASWPVAGRVWGTAEVAEAGGGVNFRLAATGNDLVLSSVPAAAALGIGSGVRPREVWREPRAEFVLELTRLPDAAMDRMVIDAIRLVSSTATLEAAGEIREPTGRGFVELAGTVRYDWDSLSRLATPWTGGRVRLAGGGNRPFAFRGPLRAAGRSGSSPQLAAAADQPATAAAGVAGIDLSDDWLAAARGVGPPGSPPRSVAASPVSVRPEGPGGKMAGGPGAWLQGFSLETTVGWQAADLFGLPVEAGSLPVRLLDGQLAFGPFDLGVSGGRVRGTPWLRLTASPAELVIPPGRLAERIDLSQGMASRLLAWIEPLLGNATRTTGRMSIDVAGGRLPLDDPFGGEAAGQVVFEELEVTPGAGVQPLVAIVSRLQGLLDPRFGIGEKLVLMRVRPEPVRLQLSGRRIWHEGLVMDMGQMMARTRGSVASDGTLAMEMELAFRGDIAGQTPVVATLLRTPITIPVRGTIERPQFDAASIDRIFQRIAENTAQAVIGEGLNRGLEALFGNPQPPRPPAPPPR